MLILRNEKMKSADVAEVAPMLVISNIGIKKGFHSFSFYHFADVAEVKKKCIVYIVLFFIENEQMNEREKSGFLKGGAFFRFQHRQHRQNSNKAFIYAVLSCRCWCR